MLRYQQIARRESQLAPDGVHGGTVTVIDPFQSPHDHRPVVPTEGRVVRDGSQRDEVEQLRELCFRPAGPRQELAREESGHSRSGEIPVRARRRRVSLRIENAIRGRTTVRHLVVIRDQHVQAEGRRELRLGSVRGTPIGRDQQRDIEIGEVTDQARIETVTFVLAVGDVRRNSPAESA